MSAAKSTLSQRQSWGFEHLVSGGTLIQPPGIPAELVSGDRVGRGFAEQEKVQGDARRTWVAVEPGLVPSGSEGMRGV